MTVETHCKRLSFCLAMCLYCEMAKGHSKDRVEHLAWLIKFIGYTLETWGARRWQEFNDKELHRFLGINVLAQEIACSPADGVAMQQVARDFITHLTARYWPSSVTWEPPLFH